MQKRRVIVIDRGREVAKEHAPAILLDISHRFRAKQDRDEQIRALARRPDVGDTANVRFAMRCVEERIVKGLWTLELALPQEGSAAYTVRNGLGYIHDRDDIHSRYADSPGGKWDQISPRPAVPSSKEIDAANEAKTWIEWLGDDQARLLAVAAMTKRGDRLRRVNWERVKTRLPQIADCRPRTLQDRYDRALRWIVAELTVAKCEMLAR